MRLPLEAVHKYNNLMNFDLLTGKETAAMQSNLDPTYTARLKSRRMEVEKTLGHLSTERRQVESNTEWLNYTAYKRRITLLDRITAWYRSEMAQIDKALTRVKDNRYGVCAACHKPIGVEQLELSPELEYCASCQSLHEH
jgi:RNA polymerase-binding transcription factor DksA